jgi:hypothetical protein
VGEREGGETETERERERNTHIGRQTERDRQRQGERIKGCNFVEQDGTASQIGHIIEKGIN